jgi:hypothetical protein
MDTLKPGYPTNPVRSGETKTQYLDRVRSEKGSGSSSGGSRSDRSGGGRPGHMGPGSGGAPRSDRGTPSQPKGLPTPKKPTKVPVVKLPKPAPGKPVLMRAKSGGMVKGKK